MATASDEFNKGYNVIYSYLENTELLSRVKNIIELEADISPFLINNEEFTDHFGGLTFECTVKDILSTWTITYNFNDLFDVFASSMNTMQLFNNVSGDDLLNIFYSITVEKRQEEDILLGSAVDNRLYRKIAKRMHYRERADETDFFKE
jgi:hypothetical protein